MQFELTADEKGRLTLKREGEADIVDVRVRRAFPWSDPDRYVSIRTAEGKELLLIDEMAALPPAQRDVIAGWLAANSFIPKINKIDGIDLRFDHQRWSVQTDRGPAEFRVQEREDIRFLADGRFRIKDADGNLYELPRLSMLDETSRKAIEVLI